MKKHLEIVVLGIVLFLMILPGIQYIEILAHEGYHASQHSDFTRQICLDFNYPYQAHTVIHLPENVEFDKTAFEKEEETAQRVGRIASILYLVISLAIIIWVLTLIERHTK